MYVQTEYEKHIIYTMSFFPSSLLFFLLTVACLLYAWAEELPAHSSAWRRRTHQADRAAVRPGPHQDAGRPGGLHSWLIRVRSGELNVHLSTGQSPTRTWPVGAASKDPGEPDPERLLSKRESETGRETLREQARMCVWNDARDEKCLTPGESDVPERMREVETGRGDRGHISSNVAGYCWVILCTSAVSL